MTTPTANGMAPFRIHHPSTLDTPKMDDIVRQQDDSTTIDEHTTEPEHITEPATAAKAHKPWPLLIIGAAAAVAVWSGWVGLGQLAGFGVIHPLPGIVDAFHINTAVVLPLSVEAYAAYALRVWLGTSTVNERAQRFAKRSAIVSMAIGAMAQIAYHLMEAAGYTKAPWPIVMLVATVPVIVLGLASALAKLVTSEEHRS
jgi:cytochrome bd-type quinol oxidase subunit 2